MTLTKEIYRTHCRNHNMPLYYNDWWLDAVYGTDHWDAIIIEKNKEILAALPYCLNAPLITPPPLTQINGIWFKNNNKKETKKRAEQKIFINQIIKQLPSVRKAILQFTPDFDYGLPLQWLGFKEERRYTYRLKKTENKEDIWNNTKENIRRECRKAENRYHLKVVKSDRFNEFVTMNIQTFIDQNISPPYPKSFLVNIIKAISERGNGSLYVVEDSEENIYAGAFIAHDHDCAYYILGAVNNNHKTTGAASLCLYHAITQSFEHVDMFDFEGSMIESIERFFRNFGATPNGYSRFTKTNSRLMKLQSIIKEAIKAIIK